MIGTIDASRTCRDDMLRRVAAVWEREGYPPGEALARAEICLVITGPPAPWADRMAAVRKQRKEAK
ncbi:hypothetical protein ACF1A4_30485 [Streptomyces albidoflavus]